MRRERKGRVKDDSKVGREGGRKETIFCESKIVGEELREDRGRYRRKKSGVYLRCLIDVLID